MNIQDATLRDLIDLGDKLRHLQPTASSMEEVGQNIASAICSSLLNDDGQKSCALARVFTTLPYQMLPDSLKQIAREAEGSGSPSKDMRCLVLVGSAGDEPQWNSRVGSRGHKAIPLPSEDVVIQAPMIASLFRQFGVQISELVKPGTATMLAPERSFNVFHVQEALNSPNIPAQDDFVIPHRIRSVIGFGGLLPGGELFAVILFFKVTISSDVAALFTKLALSVRMALLPVTHKVFK